MDPELTLDKATAAARQSESVKNQQDMIIEGNKSYIILMYLSQKRLDRRRASSLKTNLQVKHSFTSQTPPRQFQKQTCSYQVWQNTLTGNNTAQQGRQSDTNVLKRALPVNV